MIHKFERNGVYVVLDVNSGAVHVIDEMVYKILDHYPEKNMDATVDLLKNDFKQDEIQLAISEIQMLIDQ